MPSIPTRATARIERSVPRRTARCAAGVVLAAALLAVGCTPESPAPAGRAPALALAEVAETVAWTYGPRPTRTPQARIVLHNPAPEAIRVLAFEAEISQGTTRFGTVVWQGDQTYPPGGQGAFILPVRQAAMAAADAAINRRARFSISGGRITYLDALGVRRAHVIRP